ncbi:Dps family protein [Anaerobacillus isosaccharinicus]|uniref:DNA starvation/stationary phase protection protein n=1 Tax=Anaerobacillus isosaccharinicus TaxID=1532552 RepID=A0A1S2KUN2_9BACI|nr:DNA starvation/stationary phase protection protein [Anaerobacillus isosaccharinicus]MBA5585256.1 DNA starvation/stationary phase protection protein [Anaerobacillus isosaccharinicus]QOY36412.1 DNA starvation/stationary phase protection protein [Anaerobacillus isosaccharinicus]
MGNEKLVRSLNSQLADWNILFTKLHNYHWYVTGPEFFTLHTKFEEYYTEAATYIDSIAERILTIEGKPLATLKEYLEVSSIEEASSKEEAKEMVAILAADFEKVIAASNETIALAEEAGDESTADMFIGIKTSLEQHVWMLKAYLG